MKISHHSRVDFEASPYVAKGILRIWAGTSSMSFDDCLAVELECAHWEPRYHDVPEEVVAKFGCRRCDGEYLPKEVWVRDIHGMVRWYRYEGWSYWRELRELRNDGLQYCRQEACA